MKKILSAITVFTGLLLVPLAPAFAVNTASVTISDNSFSPTTLTVTSGTTVTWTNNGSMAHTVTADDNSFDSGNIAAGATYSYTFNVAGVFKYYCKYHGAPNGIGMAGTVVVSTPGISSDTTASSTTPSGLQVPPGLQFQDPGTDPSGAPLKTVVGDNGLVAILQYPNGPRLIELNGTKVIYWVSPSNIKIPVWNQGVFRSYHLNLDDLTMVDQTEFDYYQSAQFIRLNGKGTIYKIDGQTKYPIPSSIWNMSGLGADGIIDVNLTDFRSYKTGPKVSNLSDIVSQNSSPTMPTMSM